MFLHIFTYRLKCLLRNRENIFWTLLFPLILATLFYFAFSNLNSAEAFSAIDIAVVDNEQYRKDENFKAALEKASTGNDRLFNVSVVSGEKADEMLMNSEIDGYIIVDWPIRLVVSKSGMKNHYQNIHRQLHAYLFSGQYPYVGNSGQNSKSGVYS